MSKDPNTDPLGLFDRFPDPPGIDMQPVGPLGVPVPVPSDADAEFPVGDGQPTATGQDQSQDAVIAAAEMGEDYLDRVEQAIAEEDCAFCENVLKQLRHRPLDEQVKGVQELAELKRSVEGGVDPDDIEEKLAEFDIITAEGML
jgi:hypothetical protein